MIEPTLPPDEDARLQALRDLALLDTAPDERFDRITRLAQRLLGTPIALVTLVDAERQFFKSAQGLGGTGTARRVSFCAHAIHRPEALIVPDARQDERFSDNPLVLHDPNVVFYAGQPIAEPGGHRLGALCVIDTVPRTLDEGDRQTLADLATLVEREIALVKAERDDERMREGRYRDIFENATDLILAVDPAGRVMYANRAWCDALGYAEAELPGLTLPALLPAEGREAAQAVLASLVAGAEPGMLAFELVARDGRRIAVEGRLGVRKAGEVALAIRGIFRDVTARREAERAKEEFLSVVSHELRTPLTSIRASLSLLASGVLETHPEKGRRMLEIAATSADRLTGLVNDILDVERLASGKMDLVRAPHDVRGLLRQAAETVGAMAEKAGVHVAVEEGAELQAVVDAPRVLQVLHNLLSNALKFSPAGTTIRLEANPDGAFVRVAVRDQGRGIPAAKLATVFERFGQVDASDAREKGGMGIGLTICKALVEQHGGRIGVESVEGEGATFWFTLPA